jgi:hypothetical protein
MSKVSECEEVMREERDYILRASLAASGSVAVDVGGRMLWRGRGPGCHDMTEEGGTVGAVGKWWVSGGQVSKTFSLAKFESEFDWR